jgi:OST-HTH/LOTUS domain
LRLLVDVVRQLQGGGTRPQLSGLKNQLRKQDPEFSEKRYGFNTFLSFVKAVRARGLIEMDWDEDAGDNLLRAPQTLGVSERGGVVRRWPAAPRPTAAGR